MLTCKRVLGGSRHRLSPGEATPYHRRVTQCGLPFKLPLRALVSLLGLVWGCGAGADTTEGPDTEKLVVYFPIDDLVYGRGYPGAAKNPADVKVFAPRTSEQADVVPLGDGGFSFAILARSGDTLEVREGGGSSFLEIPVPDEVDVHVCCSGRGGNSCTFIDEVRTATCAEPSPTNTCMFDQDCKGFENRTIFLDAERIDVQPPDPDGVVRLQGSAGPRTLVIVENRGLFAHGRSARKGRQIIIADESGRFSTAIQGAGDDELVFTYRDLRGHYSFDAAIRVPDPPFAGIDVVAALPWEPLEEGTRGQVALLVSPYSADGLGLCPDRDAPDPLLCVGGGIAHTDLRIESVVINQADKTLVDPQPAMGLGPQILGAVPDVRAGPRDVVVVLDLSADAALKELEASPRRHMEVANFIHNLRRRDRVGLVTYGAPNAPMPLQPEGTRSELIEALTALELTPDEGPASLFDAVGQALDLLTVPPRREAHVVVIAAAPPPQDPAAARARAQALADRAKQLDPPVLIDVIGIDLPQTAEEGLAQLAAFTRANRAGQTVSGAYRNIEDIFQLGQELVELRARLFGGFLVLYEMTLPDNADKRDCIELELRMILSSPGEGEVEHVDRYFAPLTVNASPGAASQCRVR